jgi:hypothetical protein
MPNMTNSIIAKTLSFRISLNMDSRNLKVGKDKGKVENKTVVLGISKLFK